ncbi:hypothetical protein KPL71_004825 [Citrus sinensis]|uniref:Uncharacterized protein n=1 Tax=Citrus sinensis TaxID=2711 RepID=A0ACB8N8M8_CITSI|nr:hypothetical protein KPL71_004825 [Citrus sinensis]
MDVFMPKLVRRRNKRGVNDEFLVWGFCVSLMRNNPLGCQHLTAPNPKGFVTLETGGSVFGGYTSTRPVVTSRYLVAECTSAKTSCDEQTSDSRVSRAIGKTCSPVRESRHEGHATTHDYRNGAFTFERWEDNEREWREGLNSEGAYKKVANEGIFGEESIRGEILIVVELIEQRSWSCLALFINLSEPSEPERALSVPPASSSSGQYMRLGPDGHLRVYEWQASKGWTQVADLLTSYFGECGYPMVCGKYGICSGGQCSCPPTYFKPIKDRQPALGCSPITPLSCEASQNHSFVKLNDITYFTFSSDLTNTDSEMCKQACLKNCSCKAALFLYGWNPSAGECSLLSEIFSMIDNDKEKTHYNSTAYIKVQNLATLK